MPQVTVPVAKLAVRGEQQARLDMRASVESVLRCPLEEMALSDARFVCCNDAHPFAQAAHDAFYGHYPLVISPDDVWFCLAQGFAHHVKLHAESLRHRFVKHEGKKTLVVVRPDFVLGRSNPWPKVFSSFSDQIAEYVGRQLRDVIIADFSTTKDFHRAATEVVLMDTFQPYFKYEMFCGCGIPFVTLTGAPDDWRDIRRRAALFASYGLEEWVNALLPVLDQIEATLRGHGDREFWNSFFRYRSGSGGSAMTGWIQVLFPYLKGRKDRTGKLVPNPYVKTWSCDYRLAICSSSRGPGHEEINGPYLLEIPAGLASAPVLVTDVRTDTTHEMRFVAGMFGVVQDPTTASLSPSFGWAIVYDTPPGYVPQTRRVGWLSRLRGKGR